MLSPVKPRRLDEPVAVSCCPKFICFPLCPAFERRQLWEPSGPSERAARTFTRLQLTLDQSGTQADPIGWAGLTHISSNSLGIFQRPEQQVEVDQMRLLRAIL
jgi:hypothetical protein